MSLPDIDKTVQKIRCQKKLQNILVLIIFEKYKFMWTLSTKKKILYCIYYNKRYLIYNY